MTIERLERAARDPVAVTLSTDARAEPLLEAKQRCVERGVRVTLTIILARVLACAAAEHQELNSSLSEGRLHRHDSVSLGIAVAMPDGELVVPVIHQAERLGLRELASRAAELVDRARSGGLSLSDVRGGVVTLSNVGMHFARIHATPIIPPGQTAVLLTGGVTAQPVVGKHGLEVGSVVPLSLSFDHRVLNGEPALRFLADLVRRIESAGDELASWIDEVFI